MGLNGLGMQMLKIVSFCLAFALVAASARADVIYSFTQVGPAFGPIGPAPAPSLPNGVVFDGIVVVTDAAAARGFDFTIVNLPGQMPFFASVAGLVGLQLSIDNYYPNGTVSSKMNISLSEFLTQYPTFRGFGGVFDLRALPGGLPYGSIFYRRQTIEVDMTTPGLPFFSGFIRSDGDVPCFWGPCTLNGSVAVIVPEPTSFAVFGFALVALSLLQRRARGYCE